MTRIPPLYPLMVMTGQALGVASPLRPRLCCCLGLRSCLRRCVSLRLGLRQLLPALFPPFFLVLGEAQSESLLCVSLLPIFCLHINK